MTCLLIREVLSQVISWLDYLLSLNPDFIRSKCETGLFLHQALIVATLRSPVYSSQKWQKEIPDKTMSPQRRWTSIWMYNKQLKWWSESAMGLWSLMTFVSQRNLVNVSYVPLENKSVGTSFLREAPCVSWLLSLVSCGITVWLLIDCFPDVEGHRSAAQTSWTEGGNTDKTVKPKTRENQETSFISLFYEQKDPRCM